MPLSRPVFTILRPVSPSQHLVIIIFHLWLVLSAVLLMNLLIAMMNNTYNIVLAEAEQKWRLQFLDLVLFQEATPWIFSPFPCFSRANRPKHHVKGKVAVATAEGEVREVSSWFLTIEAPVDKEDDARKARKEEDGVAARLARLEAKVEEMVAFMMVNPVEVLHAGLDGRGVGGGVANGGAWQAASEHRSAADVLMSA